MLGFSNIIIPTIYFCNTAEMVPETSPCSGTVICGVFTKISDCGGGTDADIGSATEEEMGVGNETDVGTTEVTVLTVGAHETDCVTVLSLLDWVIWPVTAAKNPAWPCVSVEIWPEIGGRNSQSRRRMTCSWC